MKIDSLNFNSFRASNSDPSITVFERRWRDGILRLYAHDLNLRPSATVYMRRGQGARQRLRFSKSGDAKLEEAYATHFVWPGKGRFHPPRTTGTCE